MAELIKVECISCGQKFSAYKGSGAYKDRLCERCWPRVKHPEWFKGEKH